MVSIFVRLPCFVLQQAFSPLCRALLTLFTGKMGNVSTAHSGILMVAPNKDVRMSE